jgi:hypothetical protein
VSLLVRTLLEGILDYAGLFPPARLALDEAASSFGAYREGPERWIVNRFLCPAGRLEELAKLLDRGSAFGPVGVIGTGGADLDAFEYGLEVDARAMTAFEAAMQDRAPIESYEVRRPSGDLEPVLRDLRAFDSAEVFLEVPWGPGQADDLAAIAETEWLGAKARTGGLEAGAFPSSHELAEFLRSAQDLEITFKLTAGLHHPVRTFDSEIGVWRHGFLNVLAALRLREAEDLSTAETAGVLDAVNLDWSGDGLSWGGRTVRGPGTVRALFAGYGSCSIDEPLEELAELHLLEEVRS